MSEITNWDASLYSRFLDERTRPAVELVQRVPLQVCHTAYDLGCGPGNSTAVVKERFPSAQVTGIDNSPEMLARAREEHPHFKFSLADVSLWQPEEPCDLIFSNATFQWVEDHPRLFRRLMNNLNPDGVLAVQMPDNFAEPTHSLMREVAGEGDFSVDLSKVRALPPVLAAEDYYDLLIPVSAGVDIWRTRYYHGLDSLDAVVDWLSGTGLRPFLNPLSPQQRLEFLRLYKEKLARYITFRSDGKVLLPFPRLFIVARAR